jgi:hypothetical protein
MKIFINNSQTREAYNLKVSTMNVMGNLTFVTIPNMTVSYSLLLKLVKEGVVYSFEPKEQENIIKVSVRTKYIEIID